MDAQAIITVSAAVVALTQLFKWGFIPDKYGPISVVFLSAVGVAFGRGLREISAVLIHLATLLAGLLSLLRRRVCLGLPAQAPKRSRRHQGRLLALVPAPQPNER